MFSGSRIEISKDALRRNLGFIRSVMGSEPLMCSVVKGNAYGHGIGTFVPMAQELGVDRFAVYSASEAYELIQASTSDPRIYILGDVDDEALDWAVENGIEFNVFEMERLERAKATASKVGKQALVHVEVETGMHRTGFAPEALIDLFTWCKNASGIDIVGLCTHLAGAESAANAFRIAEQKAQYQKALRIAADHGITVPLRHVACSAGILNEPEILFDMGRIGILQYGYWPNKETEIRYRKTHGIKSDPLYRVIRWCSRVMSITTVKKGSFVGYGTSFLAQDEMRLAVVPVGYGHGYARSLSNAGQMLIRGQVANVLGIVNMNCVTIDISRIEGVEKGDEAVLIGTQGDCSISVSSFGERSDQLNYELLTRLPHDIPRIVVNTHH